MVSTIDDVTLARKPRSNGARTGSTLTKPLLNQRRRMKGIKSMTRK